MADLINPMEQAPETALAWHQAGQGAVLATVVQTWGSVPRRVGSQLVVSGSGQIEGSVSGGCVEGAVVHAALEALETGQHQVLEFGVADADAFAVGLACGGTIRILVEPVGGSLSVDLLQALVACRARRAAVAYVVDLDSGSGRLEHAGHEVALAADRSHMVDGQNTFVAIHNPPLRLVIVGAVHIAQALVPMAQLAGYTSVVVDPRTTFASAERFPGVDLREDWPDEALEALDLDARTAVVLLTHDPKLDDPALRVALDRDCFYIGALGSRKTHAARLGRLADSGHEAAAQARIKGPVGLDIGGATPAEIAVSILAEMTAVLRGKLR